MVDDDAHDGNDYEKCVVNDDDDGDVETNVCMIR